jgi:hypothetical protein
MPKWVFTMTETTVHDAPKRVFTMDRNGCSRWTETRTQGQGWLREVVMGWQLLLRR